MDTGIPAFSLRSRNRSNCFPPLNDLERVRSIFQSLTGSETEIHGHKTHMSLADDKFDQFYDIRQVPQLSSVQPAPGEKMGFLW